MAIGKWICGAIGWVATGNVLGGIAGYFLGKLIFDSDDADGAEQKSGQQQSYNGSFGSDYASRQAFQGNRNSFLFSMLVLSSYIIKADGRVMHSEMEFVRRFFRQNFGEASVSQAEQILLRLFEEQKQQGKEAFRETIRKACVEMTFHLDYSMRLQLMHYLVLIAQADGQVPPEELTALIEVGSYLGISREDIESLLNMRGSQDSTSGARAASKDDLKAAYKVLGISPDATDEEVKKAYRAMALKHHPDRVASLGEDVKKEAERKFQEINAAKDRIYKARGL